MELSPSSAASRETETGASNKFNIWFKYFLISNFVSGIGNLEGAVIMKLCLLVGLFATIPTAMMAVSFVYRKLAVTDVKETY